MEAWGNDEYLVRLRWLDEHEWTRPDRRSHELARIAQRVLQAVVKPEHFRDIKIEDQLIHFDLITERQKETPKELPELKLMELPSDHPAVLAAKARWAVLVAAGSDQRVKKHGRRN